MLLITLTVFSRLRISSWARKASKHNNLVDEAKWQAIQRAFPKQVKARLEGKDGPEYDEDDDNDDVDGESNQSSKSE